MRLMQTTFEINLFTNLQYNADENEAQGHIVVCVY